MVQKLKGYSFDHVDVDGILYNRAYQESQRDGNIYALVRELKQRGELTNSSITAFGTIDQWDTSEVQNMSKLFQDYNDFKIAT